MTFRIGQKVVCIYDWVYPDEPGPYVIKGNIYTVSGFGDWYGDLTIYFAEMPVYKSPDGWSDGYDPAYFRPVVEKKTDISIFTALLNPTERKELVE